MKKTLLFVCSILSFASVSAQEIIVGDMNSDGKLTLPDITELVNTVLGKTPVKTIDVKTLVNPDAGDPTAMAGTWSSIAGTSFRLSSDGSASFSGDASVTSYEYFPYAHLLVLLNNGKKVVDSYDVIRHTDKVVVMSKHGAEDSVWYFSDLSNPDVKELAQSVTINSAEVWVNEKSCVTLGATVRPTSAVNKKVKWTTSDPSIAQVTSTGIVVGLAAGTCTLTCAASDGSGVSSTCQVIVREASTEAHEAVDLALPSGLKWAATNVGANSPEEVGGYYAWGETETKSTYNWNTYIWCIDSSYTLTKYCTDTYFGMVDGYYSLDSEDDAARANWGGEWRIPTIDEYEELISNCKWTWTSVNGMKGYKVEGDNGNYIFLPAAGYRSGSSAYSVGSFGYYLADSVLDAFPSRMERLDIDSGKHITSSSNRCYGQSVRGVCP